MTTTRRTAFAALAAAGALAACGEAAAPAPAGLTEAAFAAWLDRYKAAWESRDPSAAGALFTENATYHEMPYDAPIEGRAGVEAYWTRVTEAQSEIVFTYNIIAVSGDTGVTHWNARFNAGGAAIELDGAMAIAFSEDFTTASSLREWWHVRTNPPG